MNTDRLTDWLLSNDPAPLAREDRALLARAVAELAIAQSLVAKQSLLLDSLGSDHHNLESTLRASLERAESTLRKTDATEGYNPATAALARENLSASVSNAQSLRDLVWTGVRLAGVLAAG